MFRFSVQEGRDVKKGPQEAFDLNYDDDWPSEKQLNKLTDFVNIVERHTKPVVALAQVLELDETRRGAVVMGRACDLEIKVSNDRSIGDSRTVRRACLIAGA